MNRFLIFCCVGYLFFANTITKAENVALNGTAAASGNYSNYLPNNVNDGSLYDGSADHSMWVSASTTTSWIYIDLEKEAYIDSVVVNMYGGSLNLQDFTIEYLKTGAVIDLATGLFEDSQWTVKDTVTGFGTTSMQYTYTETVEIKTRGIRIKITKGTEDGHDGKARIPEIEVNGEYVLNPNSISKYAIAETSDSYYIYYADNINDEALDTAIPDSDRSMWCSSSTTNSWIYLDFNEEIYVDEIIIHTYGGISNIQDFTVEYLKPGAVINPTTSQYDDNDDWYVKNNITDFGTTAMKYIYSDINRGKTKAIRINITKGTDISGNGRARIRELEVMGEFAFDLNNVTKTATVVADSYSWIYYPNNINDGMLDTYEPNSDHSMWVSDSINGSWLYLDLHKEVYIDEVIVYMYGGIYNLQDFTVQYLKEDAVINASTLQYDNDEWLTKDTVTGFNSASSRYRYVDGSGTKTRGVRINITKGTEDEGNGKARIKELEVYGNYVINPNSIAKYATAVASSYYWIYSPNNVTDQMLDTYVTNSDHSMWVSDPENTSWVYLDWERPVSIDKVGIYMASAVGTDPVNDLEAFTIQKLIDGCDPDLDASWEAAGMSFVNKADGKSTYSVSSPIKTNALRLHITDSGRPDYKSRVREIEVMGDILIDYKKISNTGSNRATAYSISNKIVTTGTGSTRKIHFGWLNENFNVKLTTYDFYNSTWNTQQIGTAVDNHGGPSLTLDKIGRMHIVYGAHGTAFKYRYTSSPYTLWSTEQSIVYGTYPSLVPDYADEDILHLVHRGPSGGTTTHLNLVYSRKNSSTWNNVKTIVAISGIYYKAYDASMVMDSNGRLHLAYVIYLVDTSRRAYYMYSDDNGSTWKKSDGTTLTLPITSLTGGEIVFEKESVTAKLHIGSLVSDSNNRPWFSTFDIDTYTANLHYYNGTYWERYNMLEILQRKVPGAKAVGKWPVSITNQDEIWLQAVYETNSTGWGGSGNRTALIRVMSQDLKANGLNAKFSINLMKDSDPSNGDWLASIERNMGQNEVSQPAFMYSRTLWNATSGDINAVIPELHLPGDSLPPRLSSLSFYANPYALSSTSVRMIASEAYDESGVEYYFEEVSGNSGGSNSGWISDNAYIDSGLTTNTAYRYRYKVRDKSSKQNETAWSAVKSVTTE
jgi:hypothetical protein